MSWDHFDNATNLVERTIRIGEGCVLLATAANWGPINFRGRTFTYSQLAGFAASGRIMVFSLDLLKDIRDMRPARGDDILFGDLYFGKLSTLSALKDRSAVNTVKDSSALIVDLATVGILLTDTLKLIPRYRLTTLLDRLSQPSLIVLFSITCYQDWTKGDRLELTKSGLDLFRALVPYLLPRWADAINPVTLVATGLCGGVVATHELFSGKY